jgi:hypothetical protein
MILPDTNLCDYHVEWEIKTIAPTEKQAKVTAAALLGKRASTVLFIILPLP